MENRALSRYKFIGHALRGDGPFSPVVSEFGAGGAQLQSDSYLIRYPRESDQKYARRNEVAFYSSPLARAVSRFVGYLGARPPTRDVPNPLYQAVVDDVDGRGNAIDVFLSHFAYQAKARGAMLLLVDMPSTPASSMAEQLETRRVPFWSMLTPEALVDFQVGDDGKFDFVEFNGNFRREDGSRVECVWHFDRDGWEARDTKKRILDAGPHDLGECQVLIFTEGDSFPHFGQFAPIADLSRRLFNLDSELDEILRAQTFSLLTMQVPDGSSDSQKLDAAKVAGETIGTNNLMVHSGSTPAFIAPPDGPARVYLDRIDKLRAQIDEIGLDVTGSMQRESGIALQMRFQALNGALARFAAQMEDLERRAWDLSQRWLGMTQAPRVSWPRDFNLADVEAELKILHDMQANGMPAEAVAAQQKRIVAVQFAGLDLDDQQEIIQAIDERLLRPQLPDGNVVPLQRPDPNAPLRDAVVRALGGADGR